MLRPLCPRAGERFEIDPSLERLAARMLGDPVAYRALRPRALAVLGYIARQVYELSGEERPLAVTRAAYDEASGPALTLADLDEATHASLMRPAIHSTFGGGMSPGRRRSSGRWNGCRRSA
jgi:hypothetical protein